MAINVILTIVIGYLFGSISSGVVLSKVLKNSDIRNEGSKNAGTTNMLRIHGKGLALLTFLCDILKGVIAVFIGKALVGDEVGGLLGVLAAVLGHNYPIFFGFKGGKGIATSFGSLLFVFPVQVSIAFAVFLVLVYATHYVSLGSIAAAFTFPLLMVLTTPFHPFIWPASIFLGGMVIYRHKANIVRLLQHKENKLNFDVFKSKKK